MEDEILDELKEVPKHVVYASFMRRAVATVVDSIILGPVTFAATYMTGGLQEDFLFIFPLLVSLFYKVFLEKEFGQTLGKKIVGIAVVNEDLRKISLKQSLIRNYDEVIGMFVSMISNYALSDNQLFQSVFNYGNALGYYGNLLGLFFLIDCLMMLNAPKNQTVHDKWANTFVVKDTFLIK